MHIIFLLSKIILNLCVCGARINPRRFLIVGSRLLLQDPFSLPFSSYDYSSVSRLYDTHHEIQHLKKYIYKKKRSLFFEQKRLILPTLSKTIPLTSDMRADPLSGGLNGTLWRIIRSSGALTGVKEHTSEEGEQQRGKLEPSSWAKSLHMLTVSHG